MNFHRSTVSSLLDLASAAGLNRPSDLRRSHISRRISETGIRSYEEIFPYVEPGSLLGDDPPGLYREAWRQASAESFDNGYRYQPATRLTSPPGIGY